MGYCKGDFPDRYVTPKGNEFHSDVLCNINASMYDNVDFTYVLAKDVCSIILGKYFSNSVSTDISKFKFSINVYIQSKLPYLKFPDMLLLTNEDIEGRRVYTYIMTLNWTTYTYDHMMFSYAITPSDISECKCNPDKYSALRNIIVNCFLSSILTNKKV